MNPTTNSGDQARVRRFTRFGITSACVVVGALLFEAVVACRAHRTMEALAELAIALGVIGEVVFHHIAGKANERLLGHSEDRVRELEKRSAPRELNTEQINRISEKLKQFAGTQYVLGVNTPLPESMALIEYIDEALEDAEWVGLDCPAWPGIVRPGKRIVCQHAKNTEVRVGITTAVRPPDPELISLRDAALALTDALWAESIETWPPQVTMGTPPPGMKIIMYINVGPKR